MIVLCEKCDSAYDDEFRSTICPHDTFLANNGKNNFAHHPESVLGRRQGHSALRAEGGKIVSYDPHSKSGIEQSLPKIQRISREDFLIGSLKLAAKRGTCCRAQVGCIIVKNGRIISTGYNGSVPGAEHCIDVGCDIQDGHCIRTVHAEANAIAFAARHGISVEECILYTYGWEKGICWTCKKLALSAGITDIVEIPLEESNGS